MLVLLCLLLGLLSACSKPKAAETTSPAIEVANVSSNVKRVELTIAGDADLTRSVNTSSTDTVSFDNITLEFGNYTFTARGFSQVSGGVVLYKASKAVSVTDETDTVALLMSRITSNISITATGAAAGETVIASAGGVEQALIVSGTQATGTLLGVPTGNVTVAVESRDASGTVIKQGASGTIALSEDDVDGISVTLTPLGGGNQAPDSLTLALSDANPQVGEEITLTITATDPDGNLSNAVINWNDGSDLESVDISGGSATKSHTFDASGNFNIAVTVFDSDDARIVGSTALSVSPLASDTDVDVDVDTDDNLSTVTLTATNVAPGATVVEAAINKVVPGLRAADLQDSYTVSLYKVTGRTWSGSVALTQGTAYTVQLLVDGSPAGDAKTLTPEGDSSSVSLDGESSTTNTAPVAVDDGSDTEPFAFTNATLAKELAVLENDSDDDGDTLTITNVTEPKNPDGSVNGTVSITGQTLTYTAADPTNNLVTFTYTVSDGQGGTATATVTVVVLTGSVIGG